MPSSRLVLLALAALTIAAAACGPSANNGDQPDAGGATCSPDGVTQCEGVTFETCSGGAWTTTQQCSALCDDNLGCVVCAPDQNYCSGDTVMTCSADGSGGTATETCSGGSHCLNGECVDLCADAATSKSYIGCQYYAVDLDNAMEIMNPVLFGCASDYPGSTQHTDVPVCWNGSQAAGLCDANNACPNGYTCGTGHTVCVYDAQHSPFAVVVSNPQSFPVNVTVSTATGTPHTVSVAAGQVQPLFPQQMGFPDASVDQSMKAKTAYKIVSDAPIVAYQFNPLDNVGVFSNDASLLIPTTTWDADYYVMSYPTLTRRTDGTNDYNGYLTVVAGSDATTVEVTPSAATRANGAVAAIAAGTPTQFTLDAYEVLNLEAVGGATGGHTGGDLTGSQVRSLDPTKPIGVFGGHEAIVNAQAAAPNPSYSSGPCCADHIEEMMFPSSTWGKAFAVARSQQRNGEPDNLRIMAQKPNTAVTFSPAATQVSGNCASLGAGQWCEVKIAGDTAITSTEPILVGHYLESVIWQNPISGESIGSGDPSLSLAVPSEQFRTDYTILVPAQYDANYVSIAAPTSGSVTVDGADVTGQLAGFGSGFRGGRIPVQAGQHKIHCSDKCGIEVMGYSDAVSYLFAGGLDLNIIVVN